MDAQLHCMPEYTLSHGYLTAVYHIRIPRSDNIVKIAEQLAIGQTIGTWTAVPGITDEFRAKYVGKVVSIYDVPACELENQIAGEEREYIIQIAFPGVHSQGNLPLLLTCLLGNDASTSAQVKLMDIIFPEEYLAGFTGPLWTLDELRARRDAGKRPLFLNMIKPCIGLTPEEGAKIFYQSALGGADIIKDDELLGSPSYSPVHERIKAYQGAARKAFEQNGGRTWYFPNVTNESALMLENAREAEAQGADGVMINFALTGYGGLRELRSAVKIPILAHCAGIGMYAEGQTGGMVSSLALGKLVRLCGADMVMMNTPYGGYPLTQGRYIQTFLNLTGSFYDIAPSIPVIGGGVHPQMAEAYIKELGKDIILAAGGAVQGHPLGAAAGAYAMRQAIDCAVSGIPLAERAKECKELDMALKRWGIS